MKTAFGIDFGTTNTRVAYFDGEKVRIVPFSTKKGTVNQLPTTVAYQNGEPVAYGVDAQQMSADQGVQFPEPMKWILGSGESVEVHGGTRDRVDVVADYLKNLKRLVAASLPKAPLDRAAVTIPVHYPPAARRQLTEAFHKAGIKVSHYFFEPIAAIYAGLIAEPVSGVAAVFDWGGGSLDIATVQLRDGVALTRQIDGWHRGGTHFDRMIAEQAVNDFLSKNRDNPATQVTTEVVLDRMKAGRDLRLQAEAAKVQLGRDAEVPVSALKFLGIGALSYKLTRGVFSELVAPDLAGSVTRLERALATSGVTPRTLARLFLSGGTCHVRDVRERIARQFGDRLTPTLKLPDRLVDKRATGGLDDIGNATAVGAALLSAFGSEPVFASAIGVRLAGGETGEQFLPVFRATEKVPFDTPRAERFFVSDSGGGVARLLICDQTDSVTQPAGRLLRVMTVPIEKTENWVDVRFTLDRHLTLKVEAAGRKSIKTDPFSTPRWPTEPEWIQSLNLGFRIPDLT
ncbi:MAG: hypothetical protein JWO38_2850 [Gemmataceae bacterium]|nr:hypothetical protein [Gemmataceae bacterium]